MKVLALLLELEKALPPTRPLPPWLMEVELASALPMKDWALELAMELEWPPASRPLPPWLMATPLA
jgi:hypothetical protein